MYDCFLEFAFGKTSTRVKIMRFEKFRILFERSLKFTACCGVILAQIQRKSTRSVRFSAGWIELQGPLTRCVCRLEVGVATVPVHVKKGATIGEAGIRARKIRIELNCPIEHPPCILQRRTPQLSYNLPAAQI